MNRVHNRKGFSLIEVIVALAIMVMMAGAITPSVVGYIDRQRFEKARAVLFDEILPAIVAYQDRISHYPRELSYLSSPLAAGSQDSCGSNLTNGERNRWSGPYIQRIVSTAGFPIFVGNAQNQLVRTPATGSGAAMLAVRVPVARIQDAEGMDELLDVGDGAAAGMVRWTNNAASTGSVQLDFGYAISGC